jgi:hypothetical protein
MLLSCSVYSQTTITTVTTASYITASPGTVTFAVKNTNTYPIAVTSVSGYHNNLINNSKSYTVWYNQTSLTGAPSINTTNGWQQLGISLPITTTNSSIVPFLNNLYLIIPPNTTYRFAISISSGYMYYGSSTQNTWTVNGVNVLTGNNTISPGYWGTFPNPTNTPATFSGSVTFETAVPDNVAAVAIVSPTNNSQFCSNDSVKLKVAIRNVGTNNETNFPVSFDYTNSNGTSTITGLCTDTIHPFTNDTIVIGKILPIYGYTYSAKAYTQLATDTKAMNDTTPNNLSFVMKDQVPLPVIFNDTICNGVPAFIGVLLPQPNTTYKWYNAGGTLLNISNNMTLANLVTDSSFYIASVLTGCESNRVQVTAKVIPPPQLFLPHDTVLCLSKPLTFNAGYPGSVYTWSTGDTTQTLTINSQPGTYWVILTNYCTVSDTSHITIHPEPICTGISYIRMGNTYKFKPSSVQNVDHYLWIFGDGYTSTMDTPTHTYAYGVTHPDYKVKLIYGNVCGNDTLYKLLPTTVHDVAELQSAIICYPNPANDNIEISSDEALLQDAFIINVVGEVVLKQVLENTTKVSINLKQLSSGTYFLNIKTNEGNLTKPIQVIR